MNELEFLRRQLATEERNLAAVTAACTAALAPERDPPADHEFLQACAAYLASAGRRASDRDAAHAALLRARPGVAVAADGALLAALESSAAARRQALAQLAQGPVTGAGSADGSADGIGTRSGGSHATDRVTTASGVSLSAALGRCLAGFAPLPTARRHALEERIEHRYGIAEWRNTALVDADGILEERDLYARVAACLPAGLSLASASPASG